MPVYLIAQLQIHDRERYASYESGFMDIFNKYDGTIMAVDEAPEPLEGEWAFTRTVLVEFPNKAAAHAWFYSDEYQQLATHRQAASEGNIVIIKGLRVDT